MEDISEIKIMSCYMPKEPKMFPPLSVKLDLPDSLGHVGESGSDSDSRVEKNAHCERCLSFLEMINL